MKILFEIQFLFLFKEDSLSQGNEVLQFNELPFLDW